MSSNTSSNIIYSKILNTSISFYKVVVASDIYEASKIRFSLGVSFWDIKPKISTANRCVAFSVNHYFVRGDCSLQNGNTQKRNQ